MAWYGDHAQLPQGHTETPPATLGFPRFCISCADEVASGVTRSSNRSEPHVRQSNPLCSDELPNWDDSTFVHSRGASVSELSQPTAFSPPNPFWLTQRPQVKVQERPVLALPRPFTNSNLSGPSRGRQTWHVHGVRKSTIERKRLLAAHAQAAILTFEASFSQSTK